MNTVRIYGLWMRDQRRARGSYTVQFPVQVIVDETNNDLDQIYPSGIWKKHNLFIFNSPYSFEFSLPANDDPAVHPQGYTVILDIAFQGNDFIERYVIDPSAAVNGSINVPEDLTPVYVYPEDPSTEVPEEDPIAELETRIIALEDSNEQLLASVPRYRE